MTTNSTPFALWEKFRQEVLENVLLQVYPHTNIMRHIIAKDIMFAGSVLKEKNSRSIFFFKSEVSKTMDYDDLEFCFPEIKALPVNRYYIIQLPTSRDHLEIRHFDHFHASTVFEKINMYASFKKILDFKEKGIGEKINNEMISESGNFNVDKHEYEDFLTYRKVLDDIRKVEEKDFVNQTRIDYDKLVQVERKGEIIDIPNSEQGWGFDPSVSKGYNVFVNGFGQLKTQDYFSKMNIREKIKFLRRVKRYQAELQKLPRELMIHTFNNIFAPYKLEDQGTFKVDHFHFDDNMNLFVRTTEGNSKSTEL